MSEVQESWKQVASKAEALGLKLKLHLEQEKDDEHAERAAGDTKAMVDEFGRKINDAFDSFGHAAKDPAVHEDVKDMGRLFRDALVDTFNAVGAEVSSRTGAKAPSTDVRPPKTEPKDATLTEASVDAASAGDEADGDDA